MSTSPLPDDWMRQVKNSLTTGDTVALNSALDRETKREKRWYTSKPIRFIVDVTYIALVLTGLAVISLAEIVIDIIQHFLISLRPILYKVGVYKKGDFDHTDDKDFLRSKHK